MGQINRRISIFTEARSTAEVFRWGLLALVSLAIIQLISVAVASSTHAAVPPDSCFTVSESSITDYSNDPGCPKNIDIPSVIDGVTITAIGSGAFREKGLTSVSLPDTVITVGGAAFLGNSDLVSLDLGEGVVTIGDYAFGQLGYEGQVNSLTSVVIPDSVTTIGSQAFAGGMLKNLTLGSSVLTIDDAAFQINDLESVTIPDSVTHIGMNAFNQNKITSLDLGEGVVSIGVSAFSMNKISSVDIPSSVQTIENDAFGRNMLTTLTIPSSVDNIGVAAFTYNNLVTVFIEGNPVVGVDVFRNNGVIVPEGLSYDDELLYRQENAEFVRIYASDPAFAAANQNQLYAAWSPEYNDDWDIVGGTSYVTGGFVINPASITINYVNSANSNLQTSLTLIATEAGVTDYKIASSLGNITLAETPNEWGGLDVTPSFNAGFSFYRTGQTITPTLPTIDGYITPEARTVTLASAANQANFVYLTQAEIDAGVTLNPDGTPSVPNTGIQAILQSPVFIVAIGLIATTVVFVLDKLQRKTGAQKT